jgi:cytochrome-b5 reductase
MDTATRIKTTTQNPYPTHGLASILTTPRRSVVAFLLIQPWTCCPGDHLYVHATINGKSVKRPYTPSSLPGTTGFSDLTVKRYETGIISKYLHDQRVGDWRAMLLDVEEGCV